MYSVNVYILPGVMVFTGRRPGRRGTNMYAVKLVVRKKEGKYVAGFASQYPLRDGYEDVASFGTWYGSQMDYAPFGQARIRAEQMADQMNEKGF